MARLAAVRNALFTAARHAVAGRHGKQRKKRADPVAGAG
jgi:hypothetical protein